MTYRITQVNDRDTMEQVEILLRREGIQKDANIDYTCAMLDEDYRVVATGSCFGNTLRCFAVRSNHQGEGLLNEIATHLFLVSEDASPAGFGGFSENRRCAGHPLPLCRGGAFQPGDGNLQPDHEGGTSQERRGVCRRTP